MPKTVTPLNPKPSSVQRQFLAAFEKGDFGAMVEAARPIVAERLFNGGFQAEALDIGEPLVGQLPEVVRGQAPTIDWDTFCKHHGAALAIGVVLGQMVDREAIKAGAR